MAGQEYPGHLQCVLHDFFKHGTLTHTKPVLWD